MLINRLILPDGGYIASGNDYPALQKVTRTQKVNTGWELAFGSVFSSMLEITLLCPDGQMPLQAGDRVELVQGTDTLGVFYVDSPKRTAKGVYKLTAYDTLRFLDKDISAWLATLTGWPYTLQTFAQMVAQECGVELLTEENTAWSFPVDRFSGSEITGRMALGWVAQALGCFCRATPEGKIEFAWYTPRELVLTPTGGNYYYQGSFSREDYRVKPVDQVCIRLNGADVGTSYPATGSNPYVIEGNPLLQAKEGQSLLGIAQALYEKLSGITYTPCKVTVPSSLEICPGQIVNVQDEAGNRHCMYVMERRRTAGRDTLSCTGSYERERSAVANRTTLTGLSGKVLNLRMDVDGISAENKDLQGNVAQMELDVGGIRTQVTKQAEDVGGLKTSVTTLEQNSESFGLRISQMEEKGTQKVETSTGYRFDKDGLWISKSGEEMENQLDNTGMYVRRSGQVILQANSKGVEATDVTVRNYLTVGEYARLEDYSNGSDGCRTACFYVGGNV